MRQLQGMTPAGLRGGGSPVCVCAGGDGALHGPGGSGWSSEPEGLRVGAEAGGCLRSGAPLLGELQEVLSPVPRWVSAAQRSTTSTLCVVSILQ